MCYRYDLTSDGLFFTYTRLFIRRTLKLEHINMEIIRAFPLQNKRIV